MLVIIIVLVLFTLMIITLTVGKTIINPVFKLSSICLLSIFSLILYSLNTNLVEVSNWLNQGKKHYLIQQQYHTLGGYDGIISKIKYKLNQNPEDIEGWLILSKLYKANHETELANAAEIRANQLLRKKNN